MHRRVSNRPGSCRLILAQPLLGLSRYELVLYFKFNSLYIISENISHLGVFLYRVAVAVFNVCYKDKLEGNICVYVPLNLSVNMCGDQTHSVTYATGDQTHSVTYATYI